MNAIDTRLAQLSRISSMVLELPPGDRAAIIGLLNKGLLMPAPGHVDYVEPRKPKKPAGTGRIVMTKKWGAYRIRHKVTNALKGPFGAIDSRAQDTKYRDAMLAKHGAEWLAANAERIGVRP